MVLQIRFLRVIFYQGCYLLLCGIRSSVVCDFRTSFSNWFLIYIYLFSYIYIYFRNLRSLGILIYTFSGTSWNQIAAMFSSYRKHPKDKHFFLQIQSRTTYMIVVYGQCYAYKLFVNRHITKVNNSHVFTYLFCHKNWRQTLKSRDICALVCVCVNISISYVNILYTIKTWKTQM